MHPKESTERVRLWDPLLRALHWALAFCVIAAWALAKFGPDIMTLHFWFGYAVIALLVVRLVWGFFGPGPARFSSFLYGPGETLRYLRGLPARQPSYWPGHNPLGALAVFALLAVLMLQTGTGLFVDADDYINVGPLAGMVDGDINRDLTRLHHIFGTVLTVIVVLHIGAVLFYRFYKGEDLIGPMITGIKEIRSSSGAQSDQRDD